MLQRAVPRSEDAAYWGLSLKELAAERSFRTRGSLQVSQGPLCVVHCVRVCVCVSVCVHTHVYGGGILAYGTTVFVHLCIASFPRHLAIISSV